MSKLKFRERKIAEQGGSLMISLPRLWANNNDLRKGDSVICIMNDDGSLSIRKEEQ